MSETLQTRQDAARLSLGLSPDEAALVAEVRPWELTGETVAAWSSKLVPERVTMLPYSLRDAPGEPGVYLLFGADGELAYIGKATNISMRLRQHRIDGRIPMAYMGWVLCPPVAAQVLEAYLIGEDDPAYNRKFDPPMVRWHAQVAAELAAQGVNAP